VLVQRFAISPPSDTTIVLYDLVLWGVRNPLSNGSRDERMTPSAPVEVRMEFHWRRPRLSRHLQPFGFLRERRPANGGAEERGRGAVCDADVDKLSYSGNRLFSSRHPRFSDGIMSLGHPSRRKATSCSTAGWQPPSRSSLGYDWSSFTFSPWSA